MFILLPPQASFNCVCCEVKMCKMQIKHLVCSVQCSLCSMMCAGVSAGAGGESSVQLAVCSVVPAPGEDLTLEIQLIKYVLP